MAPPPIPDGWENVWEAWCELTTCRQIGMAAGPVPWTAIHQYARAYDYDWWEERQLGIFVRRLDSVYFKHTEKGGPGG